MFKTTIKAKVQKLLDYYNRVHVNQWILLGNISPWENETIVPIPSSDIETILEPVKFFRVLSYKPLYVSNNGDVTISNTTYQSVNSFTQTTLVDLKVTSLLLTIDVNHTDIGNTVYRSAGLCNNLSINTLGVNVLDYDSNITYDLEGVAYFTPQSTNNILQTNILRFIIDF
jgi:hypothetical protein